MTEALMREALKPFARAAANFDEHPDRDDLYHDGFAVAGAFCTVGDLRRARDAIANAPKTAPAAVIETGPLRELLERLAREADRYDACGDPDNIPVDLTTMRRIRIGDLRIVREWLKSSANTKSLRDALEEVVGCFDAAETEGLNWQLIFQNSEAMDGSLTDLVRRRLYPAYQCAREALAAAEYPSRRDDFSRENDPFAAAPQSTGFVDIVFDGPPSHESGRFIEVENAERKSVNYGEWIQRDDGYRVLRITAAPPPPVSEIGVESVAVIFRDRSGCGLSFEGRNVFCDDERVGEFREVECTCKDAAREVLAILNRQRGE